MKILSFSAVEVLPALLDRIKTQTIRPAWNINKSVWDEELKDYVSLPCRPFKEPRFKVGEQVQIMWKQRGSPKGSWFCRECGIKAYEASECGFSCHSVSVCPKHGRLTSSYYNRPEDAPGFVVKNIFPKILGTVRITEVFEIEMHHKPLNGGYSAYVLKGIDKELSFTERQIEIPKRDSGGLWDFQTMFKWFDKHYDLSQLKKFWVYRWKWL